MSQKWAGASFYISGFQGLPRTIITLSSLIQEATCSNIVISSQGSSLHDSFITSQGPRGGSLFHMLPKADFPFLLR